jgi:hypothetical protein
VQPTCLYHAVLFSKHADPKVDFRRSGVRASGPAFFISIILGSAESDLY